MSIPAEIGRYRIEDVLGRGAMGVIYRAYDPAIDRRIAIKLIATDLLSREDREAFLRRFRREAQAAAKCAHQNIVAVYDYAMHDDSPFIAMEFVDGVSLRQMMDRDASFPPGQATFIVLQVLDALRSAHEVGVIHRDIKPANILVMSGGRVKVADFGISRIENVDLTNYESIIGTPGYMAPEQFEGRPVDARSDLFSTTAVLYELLSGQRAFPGRAFAEVRRRITLDPPPTLPPEVVRAAPGLARVIERGLAKQPADRFASALDMSVGLRNALSNVSIPTSLPEDRTLHLPPERPPPLPGLDQDGLPVVTSLTREYATRGGTGDMVRHLEQALARRLGPIAKVLVRRALPNSQGVEDLVAALAESLPDPAERSQFLGEARRLAGALWGAKVPLAAAGVPAAAPQGRTSGSSASWRVPAGEVDRAQRVLAAYVGPVARVLVRRAAAEAGTVDDLWDALAKHIDRADERARFLAERRRG